MTTQPQPVPSPHHPAVRSETWTERKRCVAWIDAFIHNQEAIIKHSKEHEDRARNCAAVALDSLRPLKMRIESGEQP